MEVGERRVNEMQGLRAGAIVLVGIVALNAGNYVFHLLAARSLGPSAYGDVVSLLALAGLIALPLGGVQVVVARSVARYAAAGDTLALRGFFRLALTASLGLGLALAAALALLSPLLRDWLGISSLGAILVTAALTVPSLLAPVVLGVAQGLQLFALYSAALAATSAARLGALAFVLALGLGVQAVMTATVIGAVAALAVPLARVGRHLRGGGLRPALSRDALRFSLLPGVVGLLALTSLTTVDVIVAKAALSDHDAGTYGAASLVGRVIVFLGGAIVTVLLPKVSARSTRGEATGDILVSSLGVTLAASTGLTLVYFAFSGPIVEVAFGSGYEDAAGLLGLFGIAMSGYAVLNVLLVYHLARRSSATSWLLLAGACVQLLGYAAFHESPRQLLAVSIATMAVLVVVHAMFVDRTSLARVAARRAG